MLSLEQAIALYTDKTNAGEAVDMVFFHDNLNSRDLDEFNGLTDMLNLISSAEHTKQFDKVFEELNHYKESIYSMDAAVDFRQESSSNPNTSEDIKIIEQLFDKEFEDD